MENKIQEEIDFTKHDIHTPEFSLSGICTFGRLVDIIDGDSLSIILPVLNNFYKYNVRLNGIDTCEMKSKSQENKELALKAQKTLLELVVPLTQSALAGKVDQNYEGELTRKNIKEILDKKITTVFVECLDFDKYGRLLANVYKHGDLGSSPINLSDYLLQHKLAYVYTGNTKLTEKQQIETLN